MVDVAVIKPCVSDYFLIEAQLEVCLEDEGNKPLESIRLFDKVDRLYHPCKEQYSNKSVAKLISRLFGTHFVKEFITLLVLLTQQNFAELKICVNRYGSTSGQKKLVLGREKCILASENPEAALI